MGKRRNDIKLYSIQVSRGPCKILVEGNLDARKWNNMPVKLGL
jgi:hypothetical protein